VEQHSNVIKTIDGTIVGSAL